MILRRSFLIGAAALMVSRPKVPELREAPYFEYQGTYYIEEGVWDFGPTNLRRRETEYFRVYESGYALPLTNERLGE